MQGWQVGVLLVGLLFLGFIVLVLLSGRKFKRVFSEGSFLEVADALPAMRSAAAELAINVADTESVALEELEPLCTLTSAGTRAMYTIYEVEDGFEHRISVSHSGGHTTFAEGEMYIQWILRVLAVPEDQVEFCRSSSPVFYAMWTMSTEAHEAFMREPVKHVDFEAFRESFRGRKPIEWQPIPGLDQL